MTIGDLGRQVSDDGLDVGHGHGFDAGLVGGALLAHLQRAQVLHGVDLLGGDALLGDAPRERADDLPDLPVDVLAGQPLGGHRVADLGECARAERPGIHAAGDATAAAERHLDAHDVGRLPVLGLDPVPLLLGGDVVQQQPGDALVGRAERVGLGGGVQHTAGVFPLLHHTGVLGMAVGVPCLPSSTSRRRPVAASRRQTSACPD